MEHVIGILLKRPLRNVLLIALFFRLWAAVFAPGYLMVDDHFMVVEAGASWVDGEDYNNWLPWNQPEEKKVHAANFFYVGTQFVVFSVLKAVGIEDPKVKMLFVRIMHALYSLLVVYFGYLITRKISRSDRVSLYVGLLLAGLAMMPNFSVRQLVEMVCIPPLMLATWALIRNAEHRTLRDYAIAGLGIGLATGLRYQCGVFGIGMGLALLMERRLMGSFVMGTVALGVFALSQLQDVFIWGEPFTQLRGYIGYNETHAGSYPNGPWYMYLFTLSGYLVPPLSFFLLFGFFRGLRKHLIVVLPALVFLVFHMLFPNKQERFIFPIIPFVIIVGTIVWGSFYRNSVFWASRKRLWQALFYAFFVLNTLGLVVLSNTYGKRSRVESMHFLYKQGDLSNFMAVFLDSEPLPPLFYTGSWESNYWYRPGETNAEGQRTEICYRKDVKPVPNYVLFYGNNALDEHVQLFDEVYGGLRFLTVVHPGFLDRVLHYLNPKNNTLETVYIYKSDPKSMCPEGETFE